MFGSLTDKLGNIFDKLRGRGSLSVEDVQAAMREIRIALLEADVALPVVKEFIATATERAIGQDVLASVTPGQQVIKIVHDTLVASLGEGFIPLAQTAAPTIYLLVGLQGSGKTTTTGKLAKRLKETERKKVLMASLDVRRPAAQEQLAQLGKQINVETLEIIAGQDPLKITTRAITEARLGGFDILLLDSAGRLSIDEELMAEIAAVKAAANPAETLLVADSMTGQDAVTTAKNFNDRIGLTGIILTRIDGDARGGAALSMRQITGQPIRFLGTGEKMDALEPYHPDRLASRILDMGDVVSLVERAAEVIDQQEAADMAAKMQKGNFDLNDYINQLDQMNKMGGMGGLMGMLPGMNKIKAALEEHNLEDKVFKKHRAMISSMTPLERRNPKLLNASRKQRITKGSGTKAFELNQLLKQHMQMQDMMKKFQKLGKKGFLRSGLGAMMGGNKQRGF
jgi:signal recognition particle subunit SRP54